MVTADRRRPRLRRAVIALALALAGCASGPAPVEDRSRAELVRPTRPAAVRGAEHVVERGDTLYGIAFRHGLDVAQLAQWNGLRAPFTIYPGQRLRLSSRAGASAARDDDYASAPPARDDRAPGQPLRAGGAETQPLRDAGDAGDASLASTQPLRDADAPRPIGAPPASTAPRATSPLSQAIRPGGPTTPPPSVGMTHASAPVASSPVAPPAPPAPAAPLAPAPPVAAVTGPQRVTGGVGWRWPAQGSLLNRFVAGDPGRQGIDIRGTPGQSVLAAADGEVVYSGNGLIGYGELIIIKHSNDFLSAYGHNRKRLVAEGGRVLAGQPIAEMGSSGSGIDLLHFEIRRRGKPVDPLMHLPGR